MSSPNVPHQNGPQRPQEPFADSHPPQGPHGAPWRQGAPQGYPPQGPPPGYPSQDASSQGPSPGYPPQGPPGYPPAGPHGYPYQGPPRRGGGALPWVIGGAALAIVLVGVTGLGLWWAPGDSGDAGSGESGASGDGQGEVRLYEGLSAEHVDPEESVDYAQHPPVGGEHYPFWQNCGVYDEPVLTEAAVHSLEHGTVWITYDPSLEPGQVEQPASHHVPGSYVLVSPMEDLPTPIVASAWGAQIQLEEASDERIGDFLREYEQSPAAPEPGAPCSGAYDGNEADFDPETVDARMN